MPATESPANYSTVTFLKPLADFADPDSAEGLELLCAANHPAEPVEWLWPGRIAVGKVTLIAGDPGLGKSVLALDVAARVTRGLAFPDDKPFPGGTPGASSDGRGDFDPTTSFAEPQDVPPATPPGSVLILSASDDLTDTIRPRLDANGADPSRVFVLPSITDLRHDFGQLKAAVDRVPNCRLIIVDPVNAFVGPSDSHFHTVVRRVLTPLTRLAMEKRIAIVAVTQLRKADGPAVRRAAGSMGLVTAAQSLWTVCRDPRNQSRNLFLPLKHNLTATARGLAFRIVEDPASRAPQIVWEPEVAPLSPEEAFAKPPKPREPSPERRAAREWLQSVLAAGPRPAREVLSAGERRGFVCRTLQRAFHELGGHTAKRGLIQGWWWSLADQADQGEADKAGEAGHADEAGEAGDAAKPGKMTNGKPEPTPNSAVIFEGVTYEEDVANQAMFDALHGEYSFGPLRAPTPAESMAALDRKRRQPVSETGHPLLDELLRSFRASPPAQAPPPQSTPDSRSKLSRRAAPLAEQVQCARIGRVARDALKLRDALKPRAAQTHRAAFPEPKTLEPVA